MAVEQFEEKKIAIYVGAALLIILFVVVLIPRPGNDKLGVLGADFFNPKPISPAPQINDLKIEDVSIGTGTQVVANGDTITINYVASFLDGKQFENSYERKQPFTFEVGKGVVMPGIDKGVIGMKIKGKRKLTIPSNLAYGEKGQGPIGPNTPVVFEIEIDSIKKAAGLSPVPSADISKIPTPTTPPSDAGDNNESQNSPTPTPESPTPTPEPPSDTPTPTPE